MGLDIVVPLEMLHYGIRSETTAVDVTRSRIKMDPADYDGATYYFEIVGTTATTSPYTITLYDVDADAAKATLSTGSTALTANRWRSSSFTPTAGNHTYELRIAATTAQSDVTIATARIVVVQVNATKTRIQFPLGCHQYSSNTNNSGTPAGWNNVTGTTYGVSNEEKANLWLKENAKFATIAAGTPWTFECILMPPNGSDTAYGMLYNRTDGTAVAGTEVSVTGSVAPYYAAVDFAEAAANFDDGDEFEARTHDSNASRISYMMGANLYVRLTSLSKAQVYWRVSRYIVAATGAVSIANQRMLYTASEWEPGTSWYLEATGVDASGTPAAAAFPRYGSADDGSGTTTQSEGITFTGTKDRLRSTVVTMVDGQNYMVRKAASSGNQSFSSVFLIAEVADAGASPTVTTAAVTSVTDDSATSGGTITDEGGSSVTAYGVCWNTTGSPTIADNHTDDS